MAAGDEQCDKREFGRVVLEQGRHQVRFHMVNRQRRYAPGHREPDGQRRTDEQRADQSRDLPCMQPPSDPPVRGRHRPDVASMSGNSFRIWSLEANSGTTPPYSACNAESGCGPGVRAGRARHRISRPRFRHSSSRSPELSFAFSIPER